MNKEPVFIVPKTDPEHYIGAIASLNLISPEGTGDWHAESTFFEPHQYDRLALGFISGKGTEIDTFQYFGDDGIFECTSLLDEMGIGRPEGKNYACTHARAIVDMLMYATLNNENLDFVCLDEWMPGVKDKLKVYALLDKAYPLLNQQEKKLLDEWKTNNPPTEL